MPQMRGEELAARLKSFCPLLKALFMSGCINDILVRRGLLVVEIDFLPKPFSPAIPRFKVFEMLDRETIAAS